MNLSEGGGLGSGNPLNKFGPRKGGIFRDIGGAGDGNSSRFQNLSGENLPSPRNLPKSFGGSGRWRSRSRFRSFRPGGGRGGGDQRGRGNRGGRGSPRENCNCPNELGFGSGSGLGWRQQNQNSRKNKAQQEQITINEQYVNHLRKKYPGYSLYFLSSLPTIINPWEKLEYFCKYLERNEQLSSSIKKVKDIEEQEYFDIIYESLMRDAVFKEQWSNFPTELFERPEDVLNICGLAVHKIVHDVLTAEEIKNSENDSAGTNQTSFAIPPVIPHIKVRLMKTEPLTQLKSIKSSLLGNFITIRGAVIRTGTLRPFCAQMTYNCVDCCGKFVLKTQAGLHTLPTRCGTSLDCQGKLFEPIETSRTTLIIDSKRIRIQDIQYNDAERGSVPRTIDCNLYNNMVELCSAGDAVTICGIVKMCKEGSSFASTDKSLHNCYLEVIALRNHKDSERTMGGNWFSFTNKDYYAVKEIHDTENLFRLLVASLCPTIYGHDLVKAGLVLSLFGGTPSNTNPIVSRRSEINVLIVGDPGLGKSQILNVVSDIAPRGVYVCGTSSSVAGLTVTMVKDGDEYSLEAGALVMADRGVCCIDEFDKMQMQHHALLEAMEQQSISVAKSGVFRTLAARTAVIAAANPVGGHYNKAKTVSENIRISPALLSRFDLTFILLDTPDEERDRNIVQHVMGLRGVSSTQSTFGSSVSGSELNRKDRNMPLVERLKFDPEEESDLIPHHLIRKYIAYAKLYAKPVITSEAAAVIKEYYLRLRTRHRLVDSTPVTTRQLESLMRLTQARAKLDLRELATANDAKDALEIFEFGLSGVFDNDIVVSSVLSEISNSMIGTPSSRTQTKSHAKKLVSNLQKLSEQQCKNIFTIDEIKQIGRAMGISNGIDNLISALNNEGLLLNKGNRVYQLQSADF